jgi:hypothetical protein
LLIHESSKSKDFVLLESLPLEPYPGSLSHWLREAVDPMTEALGRLVTTDDLIGLEAFVPEPPQAPAGRPRSPRPR